MSALNMRKISSTKKHRVLIVDYVAGHHVIMSSVVGSMNPFIRFEQASSVAEAVVKLSDEIFDAVVSDAHLPDQGSDVLVKWMRARTNFNRVPFILMSSSTDNQDIIHAFMALGVDAYVTKPFRPQDLCQKLIMAFDNRNPGGAKQ